jgi:hypothetical protein
MKETAMLSAEDIDQIRVIVREELAAARTGQRAALERLPRLKQDHFRHWLKQLPESTNAAKWFRSELASSYFFAFPEDVGGDAAARVAKDMGLDDLGPHLPRGAWAPLQAEAAAKQDGPVLPRVDRDSARALRVMVESLIPPANAARCCVEWLAHHGRSALPEDLGTSAGRIAASAKAEHFGRHLPEMPWRTLRMQYRAA